MLQVLKRARAKLSKMGLKEFTLKRFHPLSTVMEKEYWESRYACGGSSGAGSIGINREWKWQVITSFLPQIDQVIDVGCGDLSFWEGRCCPNYIGIDISETIINRNRKEKPEWTFFVSPAENFIHGIRSKCVFCFDLLFHIIDTHAFIKILNNICNYSTDYVFIYTWMENPFTKEFWFNKLVSELKTLNVIRGSIALKNALFETKYTDGKYQYFRSLEQFNYVFVKHGFKLIQNTKNPTDIGGMYIFRKMDNTIHCYN